MLSIMIRFPASSPVLGLFDVFGAVGFAGATGATGTTGTSYLFVNSISLAAAASFCISTVATSLLSASVVTSTITVYSAASYV